MKKKLPLHTQIILGLVLGLVWGLVSAWLGWSPKITTDYIKPFGTIFVNLLKMIAVPLVLASLIVGVSSLSDISKLSRIGGKTIGIYLCTTVVAVTVGLLAVNLIRPGTKLPTETRENLIQVYSSDAESKAASAEQLQQQSPLQPLVDMVPENLFASAASNGSMLQVVFFAILAGIALIQLPEAKKEPVVRFFDGINDMIIRIVEFIMLIAPYGVFALIASLIVEVAGDQPEKALQLLLGLGWYSATVVIGLFFMMLAVYPAIFKLLTNIRYRVFFKAIRPVQLLAFSTSSSSATLPLTMETIEKKIGVSEEVSSFVLPLGATINMDGTSLYQAVAAVFIAQALNLDLTLADQLMIVLTATLASVGSAGVPGAGMVMLVIVLESIGVPTAGIALIVAVDRILDMLRTAVNVTGDTVVTMVIAASEGEIELTEYRAKERSRIGATVDPSKPA
ncbi:Na+/H+-dicarboxylate symporter [Catalinimonas alkaloidigena]|uniref:Na+/H+-dicarboxylate symporter n=1 Tax=Catalinimonas alkaloidigena TaxID=1075417 RepID=A0A1G9MXJ0_9BACT|nr:dicarboxylate/amino acid:cation symporter [Catalinimonas alkaloidigena]SDL78948.1 Na+/H+-dicarboxylate symporter [Catalinimonas alkaloidigena]